MCWYQLTNGGLVLSKAAAPSSTGAGEALGVRLLIPEQDGGALLVAADATGAHHAWRVAAPGRVPQAIALPLEEGEQALTGAQAGGVVFLGTTSGLIRVSQSAAARFDEFADQASHSYMLPFPTPLGMPVRAIAVDGAMNVWLTDKHSFGLGHRVFSADERTWTKLETAAAHGTYPCLRQWFAPGYQVHAVAGICSRGGLWAYATDSQGEAAMLFLDPLVPGGRALKGPARVVRASVLPEWEGTPLLAGVSGHVWLAGNGHLGCRVYAFDGQQFSDVSPPGDLIRARTCTGLAATPDGTLFVATDGAGILVLDAHGWRVHPISNQLTDPVNADAKPIECMAAAQRGDLWVACGPNLLCWHEAK